MLDTRLILIEGFPGAGKSTLSANLGTSLRGQGLACRWYLEDDDPHPIDCLDLKLTDLAQKLPPLWRAFTEQASLDPTVTIMESRLWQNTAFFMYMGEYPVGEIIQLHRLVWEELTPLNPVLLYLHQENVEVALSRLYTFRGEKWMESALETTSQYPWFRSRGLNDFAGWVQFFREWQLVADQLYDDWPYSKIKVENPYADWGGAYRQIYRFMQIDQKLRR